MSETVKFSTNVPETLSLAFSQGKEVTSQYGGDQVMFSLDDGRRMYVSPYVAGKIYEAGISAHTDFTLCKREVTHGNRRAIEWEIQTFNEAARVTPTTPTTHDAMVTALKASLVAQTKTAATVSQAAAAVQSTPAPVAQTLSQADQSNGNAYADAPAWVNAPASSEPRRYARDVAELIAAFESALDVADAVETYAADNGRRLSFGADDIRAIAASLFIQRQKGGAR